jgi:hypothetical protein
MIREVEEYPIRTRGREMSFNSFFHSLSFHALVKQRRRRRE